MAAAATPSSPTLRLDAFDSDDFSNNGGREREVDLSQLFSDVSKTVGNLRNILSNRPEGGAAADTGIGGDTSPNFPKAAGTILNDIMGSRDDQPGPIAKLFGGGNVCFKTCGMEDIQFAARRAGEMFMTMKVCLIILTFVAVICFLAITVAVLFYIYKNRHAIRQFASSSTHPEDSTMPVTPLIFSKRTPPMLSNNSSPPKPPAHQSHLQINSAQQKHSPVSSVISTSTD